MTPEERRVRHEQIILNLKEGMGHREAAAVFGVSRQQIWNIAKKHGIRPPMANRVRQYPKQVVIVCKRCKQSREVTAPSRQHVPKFCSEECHYNRLAKHCGYCQTTEHPDSFYKGGFYYSRAKNATTPPRQKWICPPCAQRRYQSFPKYHNRPDIAAQRARYRRQWLAEKKAKDPEWYARMLEKQRARSKKKPKPNV